MGRVVVEPDLSMPGVPPCLRHRRHDVGPELPGLAQVAIQGANYAVKQIEAISPVTPWRPGTPSSTGTRARMATVFRFGAVGEVGKIEFGGLIAWLSWLVLDLYYLVGYRSRIMTIFSWAVTFLDAAAVYGLDPAVGERTDSRSSRSNARNTRSSGPGRATRHPRDRPTRPGGGAPGAGRLSAGRLVRGPDTMPETIPDTAASTSWPLRKPTVCPRCSPCRGRHTSSRSTTALCTRAHRSG